MAALTLLQRLESAEQAYHDLMIGQSARVFVDQNGERVEYTSANSVKLAQYIELLKKQISPVKTGGPAKVWL